MTTASVSLANDITKQLRAVATHYDYHVKAVSWEDCTRTVQNGQVSCWGPNISDVRIVNKDKSIVYTVRSNNWNERIGIVDASKIALVIGNEKMPANAEAKIELKSETLASYLHKFGERANYLGVPAGSRKYSPELDNKVSVRFQTVFLPQDSEFTTNVYSYGSYTDDDPQNMLLYCTAQGTSVHQSREKASNVYLHQIMPSGYIQCKWLHAKASDVKVGQSQDETKDSVMQAIESKSAFSRRMGVEAMGNRFNAVMMVQVPLKQRERQTGRSSSLAACSSLNDGSSWGSADSSSPHATATCALSYGAPSRSTLSGYEPRTKGRAQVQSYASRVSAGTTADGTSAALTVNTRQICRHPDQHITVTITHYYVVKDGVPTEQDIVTAIKEMNSLYKSCGVSTTLMDDEASDITTTSDSPMYDATYSVPDVINDTFPQ